MLIVYTQWPNVSLSRLVHGSNPKGPSSFDSRQGKTKSKSNKQTPLDINQGQEMFQKVVFTLLRREREREKEDQKRTSATKEIVSQFIRYLPILIERTVNVNWER
jgi:hypothetical protein